jgi:hypothetical protein
VGVVVIYIYIYVRDLISFLLFSTGVVIAMMVVV